VGEQRKRVLEFSEVKETKEKMTSWYFEAQLEECGSRRRGDWGKMAMAADVLVTQVES